MADRRNNFDLLRVLAALQVVHVHTLLHLHLAYGAVGQRISDVLALFPGVPIFFVISGFLISMSYERSASLGVYARNRFLRIYPGLWVCFGVSLLLLAAFGVLTSSVVGSRIFWAWVGGQLTIVQVFNPTALRSFGVGVLNGSLWTIPVELQFYFALPILYRCCLQGRSRRVEAVAMSVVAALSFAVWCFWQHRTAGGVADTTSKLLQATLVPHLFMFLGGVALQRNWDRVAPLVEGRAAYWIAAYLGWRVVERILPQAFPVGSTSADLASAAGFVLLAFAVIALAYTRRGASHAALRGHDLSYGIYIYHMLVVNVFVQLGMTHALIFMPLVVAIVIVLATASWLLVERPALRVKRMPANAGRADKSWQSSLSGAPVVSTT